MLLAILAKLAMLPSWMKVGAAAVLVVGSLEIYHRAVERGLRSKNAEISRQLGEEQKLTAQLKVGLAEVQLNRDQLALEIRRQNEAIGRMQIEARAHEQAAVTAAIRKLQEGRKEVAVILDPRTPAPTEHDRLNARLREMLR